MSFAHVHLLLNHVPVIGLVFTIALLGWGVWRRERIVIRAAFFALAVLAVTTILVFLTGEPAEELVEGLADVSHSLIESHEEAALVATIALGGVGVAALAGLVFFRSGGPPVRFGALVLLLSLAAMSVMAYTANLGGQIRHSEIRADQMALDRGAPVRERSERR